jgi:hypothetical protein
VRIVVIIALMLTISSCENSPVTLDKPPNAVNVSLPPITHVEEYVALIKGPERMVVISVMRGSSQRSENLSLTVRGPISDDSIGRIMQRVQSVGSQYFTQEGELNVSITGDGGHASVKVLLECPIQCALGETYNFMNSYHGWVYLYSSDNVVGHY